MVEKDELVFWEIDRELRTSQVEAPAVGSIRLRGDFQFIKVDIGSQGNGRLGWVNITRLDGQGLLPKGCEFPDGSPGEARTVGGRDETEFEW